MSTSGQLIDKLVEKCRRGDDKACSELRSYREFLEERLKSSEYLFISSLIVIFITLMSQKFIINILTVTLLTALLIIMVTLAYRIHELGRLITRLYEVLGDPTMPWRIDPLVIGGLVAGTLCAIVGIMTALGII